MIAYHILIHINERRIDVKNVLFLGRDLMSAHMAMELKDKYNIDKVKIVDTNDDLRKIKFNDFDIFILPIRGITDDGIIHSIYEDLVIKKEMFDNLSSKKILFVNNSNQFLNNLSDKVDIITYNNDDKLQEEKDFLVADAIFSIMAKERCKNIGILGYDHLAKLVMGLGQNFKYRVGVNDIYQLLELENIGFYLSDTLKLNQIIHQSDLVINTISGHILTENALKDNEDVYILDVSDYPYGVSDEVLNTGMINYHFEPYLFEKHAPYQMGKILTRKIFKEGTRR